jgi:hypothetical protein
MSTGVLLGFWSGLFVLLGRGGWGSLLGLLSMLAMVHQYWGGIANV